MDYCRECDRSFHNIRDHFTYSSKHIYCDRCNRHFSTASSRQMHWEKSAAHNLCDVCGFDGEDWDELEDHYSTVGCYPYCCHGCDTWFRSKDAFTAHLEAFFVCRKCDKHCLNKNNLDQHMVSHDDAKLDCWGCYNKYIRLSHLILHLESGTCASGCCLRDINYKLLAKCNNIKQFVNREYIADFRRGKFHEDEWPFKCMTCGNIFRYLSGLCQHMENSSNCDQHISDVSFHSLQTHFEDEFLSDSSSDSSSSDSSSPDSGSPDPNTPTLPTRRESGTNQPTTKSSLSHGSTYNKTPVMSSISHAADKKPDNKANHGLGIPVKCWGCNRKFNDVFRMIVHLEFGSCASLSKQSWFDSLIPHIRSWKKVIVDENHKIMLAKRKHVTNGTGPHIKPFHCDKCDKCFQNFSGLVFHALHEEALVDDGSGRNVKNNPVCSKGVDDLMLKEIEEVFASVFCVDGP